MWNPQNAFWNVFNTNRSRIEMGTRQEQLCSAIDNASEMLNTKPQQFLLWVLQMGTKAGIGVRVALGVVMVGHGRQIGWQAGWQCGNGVGTAKLPCHRAGTPRECSGRKGAAARELWGSAFFVRTWRADASEPLFADWWKRVETSLQARWRNVICPLPMSASERAENGLENVGKSTVIGTVCEWVSV